MSKRGISSQASMASFLKPKDKKSSENSNPIPDNLNAHSSNAACNFSRIFLL